MYVVLIVVCAATYVFSNPFYNPKENKDTISKCLFEISQKCLYNKPTVLFYYQPVEENDTSVILSNDQTQLKSTLNYFSEYNIPVIVLNDLNSINGTVEVLESSKLVVTFFKNIEFIKKVDLALDYSVKYLFVIESTVSMENLQNMPFDIQTYDVTLILADYVKREHTFLSCVPSINEDTCNLKESPLREINSCKNGELEKKNVEAVFPSKIPKNYKLCPFNVGMATMFPYSIIPNKNNMKNLDRITAGRGNGSDIEMVKIIAQDFNATLNLFYIFREEENPFLHMEYLNYLFNKTLDACAGGLYHIYGEVVAYSGLYSTQSVIWVYTVERDIRSWQSLGYKVTDVYYFFVVYLIYSIIWTFVRKYDKNNVSFMKTIVSGWGALLGTTSLQDPKSLKQKILNIAYLVMSLHLSAYIGAQIYSYLTIQGPPQTYKTLEELTVSDNKPYLQTSTKYFIKDKNYEEFVNTSGECKDFRNCENIILANMTGTTIILDAYLLPFQAETAVNDEARVLGVQESVLTVWHEMIMRKDFALEKKLQDIVTRLFEAGICDKLYNEAIGITVVDKAKIANKNILSNSYNCTMGCEITLVQMGGAFYLWLFGCLLSFAVFLVEVVYERLKSYNTVYLA